MDVISMPEVNGYYRVMPSAKGLVLNEIGKNESDFKLARVENKTTVHEGVQIALHDGSNILLKTTDPKSPPGLTYETFDVLKLKLPEKQVLSRIKTKVGNLAIITGGKNIGIQGRIVEIEKTEAKKRRNALVVIEDEKRVRYQTILDYVFSVGEAYSLVAEVTGGV
jgi:small subunit ribosomal protein S4e